MSRAQFFVRTLQLTQFRSHAELTLNLDARPVCLIGPNGAGKTNILEALTMLAPGRGLRSATLVELARGAERGAAERARPWSVFAELERDGAVHRLGVGAERTPEGGLKRLTRLNGRSPSAAEMAVLAPMVWVTPAMDRLFSGPPGDRRRFLDRLTLARAPEHAAVAAAYERAQRERQKLLGEGAQEAAWLAGLEQEMAASGAALAAARVETLVRLRAAIAAEQGEAFPRAEIAVQGDLEQAFEAGRPSAEVEDDFVQELRRGRARDAAAGRAIQGPHRSDLLAHHADKQMPASLCSTGEQKALLVGLVLAHVRSLAADAGPSLLLLDEAGAHLDETRRAALAEEILALPGQTWLTGTDASLFTGFGEQAQRLEL